SWSRNDSSRLVPGTVRSRLPARALVLHVVRRRLGDVPAEVALHHGESEVDPGREAARGGDPATLDEAQAAAHVDVGELLGEAVQEEVVRGGGAALQEPGLPE